MNDFSKRFSAFCEKPKSERLSITFDLSRRRITTFSPYTVGKVATRMSMGLPPTIRPMRPSCGTRRSAMSSSAMIFRRLMTPACMRRGTDMISCSTPSTRKRIMSSLAWGSKWMSLAPSSTDCAITELTSLMMGASSVASRMSASSPEASSKAASSTALSSMSGRSR